MPPGVSRCLSAAGVRFLGILFPPGVPLSSRSAYQAAPGPWRGFHVPHIRVAAGLGALFTPRPSGAHTAGPDPSGRRSPPLPGARPYHPGTHSTSGAVYYEASSRVHSRSPARPSPSPVGPGWHSASWACSPGFAPCQAGPASARRSGGRASSTRPELYARHLHRTSFRKLTQDVRPRVAQRAWT